MENWSSRRSQKALCHGKCEMKLISTGKLYSWKQIWRCIESRNGTILFCRRKSRTERKKETRKQVKRFITIILFYLYASLFLSVGTPDWGERKIIIKQKHTTTKANKNYFPFSVRKVYNFIVEIYELLVVSGLSNHWVGKESDMRLCRKFCGNLYKMWKFSRFRALIHFYFSQPNCFCQTQLFLLCNLKSDFVITSVYLREF